jgi:MFS family permease
LRCVAATIAWLDAAAAPCVSLLFQYCFSIVACAIIVSPRAPLTPTLAQVLTSVSGAALMLASFAAVPFALSGASAAALLSFIRFLNGVASAWVESTMMTIACNFLPDKVGAITGLVEAAIGLGVMIGPIIGSSLHTFSTSLTWNPARDNMLFVPFMATAAIEVRSRARAVCTRTHTHAFISSFAAQLIIFTPDISICLSDTLIHLPPAHAAPLARLIIHVCPIVCSFRSEIGRRPLLCRRSFHRNFGRPDGLYQPCNHLHSLPPSPLVSLLPQYLQYPSQRLCST